MPRKNLLGMRFGAWRVLAPGPRIYSPNGNAIGTWRCRCDCGVVKDVRAPILNRGASSGCARCAGLRRRDAGSLRQRAEAAGLSPGTVYSRIRQGWSTERALSEPLKRRIELNVRGERAVLSDLLAKAGISPQAFYARVKRGWSPLAAATTPKTAQGGGPGRAR